MRYNVFIAKIICLSIRDSKIEGVPTKMLGRAPLRSEKLIKTGALWGDY